MQTPAEIREVMELMREFRVAHIRLADGTEIVMEPSAPSVVTSPGLGTSERALPVSPMDMLLPNRAFPGQIAVDMEDD